MYRKIHKIFVSEQIGNSSTSTEFGTCAEAFEYLKTVWVKAYLSYTFRNKTHIIWYDGPTDEGKLAHTHVTQDEKLKIVELNGELFDWFETGLGGVVWALQESRHISGDNWSYEGLKTVDTGDFLKAYDNDKLVWQGVVEPDSSQKVAGPLCTHWTQFGMKPIDWAKLFCETKTRDHHLRGVLYKLEKTDQRIAEEKKAHEECT